MEVKMKLLRSNSRGDSKPTKIIWNITKICGWDCEFCCVDAYHVSKNKGEICIKSKGLTMTNRVPSDGGSNGKQYEIARDFLVSKKMEIGLIDKLRILDNINLNAEIDFSGGDPLLLTENLFVIEKASQKFGKENISLTATGIGFSLIDVDVIASLVGGVDFTYDFPKSVNVPFRPNGYNHSNLSKVMKLAGKGVSVTAQIPLSEKNISEEIIEKIFHDLHSAGVRKILLMRIFPVGRGSDMKLNYPSIDDYLTAIEKYKSLQSKYGFPLVNVQTGLKKTIELGNTSHEIYDSSHLNITQLGILSKSPWAFDKYGEPIPEFVIGDMKHNSLSDLLGITIKKDHNIMQNLRFLSNKAASLL